MEDYSRNTKVGILRYMIMNVALPLLLFFICALVGYVTSGIYQNYQSKKAETVRLAKNLAISASYNDPALIISQVNQSMLENNAIEDIQFYSIEHAIELEGNIYNDWKNALFRRSVNFHEEVIVNMEDGQPPHITYDTHLQDAQQDDEHQHEHQHDHLTNGIIASHTNANSALIGYINVTLDLQTLRMTWFKQNLTALLLLIVTWLMMVLVVFLRLLLPLKEFTSMIAQINKLNREDELALDPLIHSDVKFNELDAVKQLIAQLDNRYKTLVKECDGLKQQASEAQGHSQATSQSSHFQSMIVHELKSSLNDISDGLQLIDKSYLSEEQATAVMAIREGKNELNFTLNQIIQLNRIEKGQLGISYSELQPTQMINSLVQAHEEQALKKGLTLKADIHHVDYILAGDVKKIQTILDELVLNAIKYTQKGSVTIDSKLMYFVESIRWTVKVQDTGIGIEEKYLEDIFLPFFQGNLANEKGFDGTGVGLGIARKLTELLEGSLTAESEEGVGSTFTLVLQLRSWDYNELFTMLTGIKILALDVSQTESHIKDLETYGATIDIITERFALIEQIKDKPSDVLLISDKISSNIVVKLCQAIREQETSHRILIVWYHKDMPNYELAELEAIGLDYIINPTKSPKEQATAIHSWVMG